MGEAPNEIKGWNWGAFMFSIIWGIGNRTYLPLLCLIPFFNIVWVFVCGFKGNEWAWNSGQFLMEDVNTFKEIQKTWNRAGLVWFIIVIALIVLYLFLGIALFSYFVNY